MNGQFSIELSWEELKFAIEKVGFSIKVIYNSRIINLLILLIQITKFL